MMRAGSDGVPTVFLLTSHPIAPPWNGGDKNLARTLIQAGSGVNFRFIGSSAVADGEDWFGDHERVSLMLRTDAPSFQDKARLFLWLGTHGLQADVAHAIITFQRSTLSWRGRALLPLLRRQPLVLTCTNGSNLPLALVRAAQSVVAISDWTAQRLAGLGAADVRVIRPAVDTVHYRPGPPQDAMARLGLDNRPTLLFAGHFDTDGGLEAALEVLRKLKQRVPNVRLLLAMRHRPGQDPVALQTRLERTLEELGLRDAVVELGDRADILLALQASTATIFQPGQLALKLELPLVLLESLAAGRPVVASTLKPLDEIGQGSLSVTVAEPASEAVIDHLYLLLTDRGYAQSLSEEARQVAEDLYSSEAMAAAYTALYRELA